MDGVLQRHINNRLGFGLIEVLVTAVIMAVGLTGLASLQNRSVQATKEGDNLVTAAIIAEEMSKRMLSNPYITAQGRLGYLATDLNDDVANAGGVADWVADTLSNNPDITRCYSADDVESCYAPSATIGNSADHIVALQNMQTIDQVEMRVWASNNLPNGEIKICFDSSTAYTAWTCDDVATRVSARNENVYTIKVQWTDIFTNTPELYSLQFTAECSNGDGAHCG